MNRIRRKALDALYRELEDIQSRLEAITCEEEEDYRDNIPENLQGSERYEAADAACDSLRDAYDMITDALDSILEAV